MTVTALAVAFLFLIIVIAVAAQWLLTSKKDSLKPANSEQCTICRKYLDKSQLVERQIGDIKVLYFCKFCIEALSAEATSSHKESLQDRFQKPSSQ